MSLLLTLTLGLYLTVIGTLNTFEVIPSAYYVQLSQGQISFVMKVNNSANIYKFKFRYDAMITNNEII